MNQEGRLEQFVTRQEFAKRLDSLDNKVDARFLEIAQKLDSRMAGSRQIWLAVASMIVAFLTMGGALVAFSQKAAVAPVEVRVAGVETLLAESRQTMEKDIGDNADLSSRNRDSAVELRARLDIIQGLIVRDIRIDHGKGGGVGLAEARLEQTQQRQAELWQLVETVDLKVQKLSERLAAQDGSN